MAIPQHYVPPSPRELRAQAVQRLQVGLFGLAMMLLLVGLADIIMQHARQADVPPGSVAAKAASSGGLASDAPADPLADIGVAPSPDGEGGASGRRALPRGTAR